MENNLSRCMTYLSKLPPAIANSGGDKATRQAAMTCHRFGLTEGETWDAMQWFNENRCQPAWSEKELRHKMSGLSGIVVKKPLGQPQTRTHRPRGIAKFVAPEPIEKPVDMRPICKRSDAEEELWWAQWCADHGTTLEAFDQRVGNG